MTGTRREDYREHIERLEDRIADLEREKRRSIAHHMIERNGRVLIETPVRVIEAVWHGIAAVVRARHK